MALVTCPDCRREISAAAIDCPHCGRPMAAGPRVDPKIHGTSEGIFMQGLNCGCAALLGLILLVVILTITGAGRS